MSPSCPRRPSTPSTGVAWRDTDGLSVISSIAAPWRSHRFAYGPFPDQFGDLRVPEGGGRHLVVVVHGGLWRHEWTRDTIEGLAVDLASLGYVTWNLEYRRVGTGGGWPESFEDVSCGSAARRPPSPGIGPQGHRRSRSFGRWDHGAVGRRLGPGPCSGAGRGDGGAARPGEGGSRGSRRRLGEEVARTMAPGPRRIQPTSSPPDGNRDSARRSRPTMSWYRRSHGMDYAAASQGSRGFGRHCWKATGLHNSFLDPKGARLEGSGRLVGAPEFPRNQRATTRITRVRVAEGFSTCLAS